jgi:hypothetical protein
VQVEVLNGYLPKIEELSLGGNKLQGIEVLVGCHHVNCLLFFLK